MPQIDLRLGLPPGLVFLLAAAAITVAVLFYRKTLPPVGKAKRYILASLRALALVLLAFLLAEPVLQFLFRSAVPPTLTVLVDNSRSMSLAEHGGTRGDIVRGLLQSPVLESLRSRATVRLVPFGASVRISERITVDSLSFSDDGTDIAGALSAVQERDRALHSNAVLLLTDGIVTLGQNPLRLASTFPMPITAVGIGDSSERMDIALQRIAANAVVYSGTPTPVQAFVHATGYQNQRLEVTLSDGSSPVGRATLALEPGSRDYAVPFTWTPTGEGMHTLTASTGNLPGEMTTRNNRQSVSVRVRKSKLKVLILAGAPSHDLAFFRSAAADDPNVTVSAFSQTTTGAFYEGPLTGATLDSADCLVLIGMPTSVTTPQTIAAISSTVSRHQVPLLWIGGRTADLRQAASVAALLPFSEGQVSQAEQEVGIDPAPNDAGTPLLAPAQPDQPSPWQQLPPIFATRTVYTAKPGAQTIATIRISGVATPAPAIVTMQQPHKRSIALLCYGIWRWRLLAQRSPAVADFFPHMVGNMLRWLTSPDNTSPVIVKPMASVFGQGEPLSFEAQVYDIQQRPLDNAQVTVAVRQQEQTTEGAMKSVGNGRYEGSLPGASEEGVYRYRAVASKDGVVLGADSGTVRVGGTHVEFLTTQTQAPLLRALAERSGGSYLEPGQFARLPEELERQGFFSPHETTQGGEIQLRSWPYLAALVILLLAIEWFIRKSSGMI